MDWDTVSVILATGVVTSGSTIFANRLQNKWSRKREDREARRKYREEVAGQLRKSLVKLQNKYLWINLSNKISEEAKKQNFQFPSEMNNFFDLYKVDLSTENIRDIYFDCIPLLAMITNEKTKQAMSDVFFYSLLNSASSDLKAINEVHHQIEIAYKELEVFATSAD